MSSFSDHQVQRQAAIHPHYARLAVSLELSRLLDLLARLEDLTDIYADG